MSLTIAKLLRQGAKRLAQAGIDDAKLSSRLFLQHLLNKTPSELQLASDNKVGNDIIKTFNELIDKRCKHFPLQYLIGEVEFYNVRLKVNQNVLIPRPETEVLVETLIDLLKDKQSIRLLDIGIGSGNIAIALAVNIEAIKITAIDISETALNTASENARLNRAADKIDFRIGDCQTDSFWDEINEYDVIVSNPPYIASDEFETLQPEVKLYEPKESLIAGDDPLIFFKAIVEKSNKHLKPDGIICFEVGIGQASDVAAILKTCHKNIDIKVIKDLAGIERVVIGRPNI
ncbi:MAG: peptide chain release factor N(5)-glutamine methyltransferase [candidate division Zixibacteria bacterium]|nr:peptide chain release factor N(5)-glutamine methyltransferase [candidate division Zixibacteria bacterium]